jgi:hypothetical protein
MGIFEKSIPKYVVNPIDQQVEVAPQDVYVDDIFDPIFNANVRNALRQKYGGGLYGVVGGYKEMLKNAWTGGEGILGKGMGVLSTFGRSMEKADDIALGLLTEGVEGLTGQGFDNPLKQIFVEDEDYSGKRFLASTANIFRNLAGGTTITEADLGTAWNIPGLGIDLATDVGILGSNLSRRLAPAAREFTSKELFENLGKSDLKTTVGEVGQLMSNYDDLMTKVAIDATAPGLRPAFKSVKNKLMQHFATHSDKEFIDVVIAMRIVEDTSAPVEVRKKAQEFLQKSKLVNNTTSLFKEPDDILSDIPDDVEYLEFAEQPTVDRIVSALQRDLEAEDFANKTYSQQMDVLRENIRKSRVDSNKRLWKKFEESRKIASKFGWETDLNRYLELTDPIKDKVVAEEVIPTIQTLLDSGTINPEYIEPVQALLDEATGVNGKPNLNPLRYAIHTREFVNNDAANNVINTAIDTRTKYIRQPYTPYRISPSLRSAVHFSGAPGISYSHTALQKLITQDLKSNKKLFSTSEELKEFFNTPEMQEALSQFIPESALTKAQSAGLSAEDITKKQQFFARNNRAKLVELLDKVYFPGPKTSMYDYTKSLIDLENLIAKNAHPEIGDDLYRWSKSLTAEEVAKYSGHPEKMLSLEDFLASKGLVQYEHYADYIPSNVVKSMFFNTSGVDEHSAAQFLLTGKHPDNIKYIDKYRKANLRIARRLKSEYSKQLQHMLDSIQTPRNSAANDFLINLFDTVDDISQSYLQPLRDEIPHNLVGVRSGLSLDKPLRDGSETTFEDILENTKNEGLTNLQREYRSKNTLDSEYSLALSRAVRDWARNAIPSNATFDQVREFSRPLSEYLDFGYKLGADTPIPIRATKAVSVFYSQVLPIVERIMSNGAYGNLNIAKVFTSDSAVGDLSKLPKETADDVKKLRNLLGTALADKPHTDAYTFRTLFNTVVRPYDAKKLNFESAHGGVDADTLSKKLQKPHTPQELRDIMYPYFDKAYYEALSNNQHASTLVEFAQRFDEGLDNILEDLGFSESYVNTLFNTVRQHGISAISPKELSDYRAYVHEVSKLLSQTPYRVYARNALQYSAYTDWNLIRDAVDAKYPSSQRESYKTIEEAIEPAIYYEDPRLQHLNQYHDAAVKHHGVKTTSRKKVLENVTHVPSPQSAYLDKLLKREREYVLDTSYQKRLKRWYAEHPYYTYLKDWHENYFKIPHPSKAVQEYYKQVSDKLSEYSTELHKLKLSSKKDKFYYTKKDFEFVRDKVIPLLPNNVRGYWNPSKKKGLFNFDLPEADDAYTFQLGMDVDVRPERFQIEKFLREFKGDVSKLDTIRTVDYGILGTQSGRRSLEETAAKTYLSMDYLKDDALNRSLTDVYRRSFNEYRTKPTTKKAASETVKDVKDAISSKPIEEVAEESFDSVGTASATAEETVNKMASEMNDFANKGGSESAGKTIFGERKWRWFKIIKDALSVSEKNAWRGQRATLRTTRATELAERFRGITSRITVNDKFKDFKRFYILRQKEAGDIVTGKDFWTTFRRTGILVAPYEAGSKQLLKTQSALTENANLINKAAGADIVEVVTQDYGKGKQVVIMRFKGDKNTVKYVKKSSKALGNAKYSDVVFSPPTKLTGEERLFMDSADMRELSVLMDELQTVAGDQAKLLGFNFDNTTPYTHHAMHRDKGSAEWLNRNFYTKLSSEDYDDISKLISNFDEYRKTDRGAFGTMLQDRRFRGDYFLLDDEAHSLFEYSPDKIFTSTLADGMFANLQYQDFTDLFINDNFKIAGFFKTPEDLKKVLYAKDSKGRLSGNFANSELISFRLDENGKIAGLVKYDKTTDAGLAKALADKNTILVPANAVSHMDNILRKDVRMNNKFWTFINKHFTIPFKFGLLSNPGFLLGNVSDATLKLATTMSEKYGTTLTEELANVTECINASQVLKNNYYEAFDVWKKVSAEYDIKLSPEATVADIVAMSPKYKEQFLNWLNGDLKVPYTYQNEAGVLITEYREVPCELANSVVDNASIWTMLQGVQMNSDKMREYADLAEIAPNSEFDVATNMFDRITQGSGKYDRKNWRTWGLFMNNPYMKTLTDASGAWEDVIRTASILDDLRHGQYSKEDFAKFARGATGAEDAIQKRVRLDEAKNTMYNAQFDYERQSDFISKIGKTVPFPIFFLKNFEYWMELFDKNPQFVDNAIDVQEGLWSGYNEEGDKFMTEAKGRGAIPIGGDALPKWFKGVYKPSPLQSMFGAFNLLNDPVNNLTYRVNPVVSGAKVAATEMLPDSDLTTLLQDPENVKYRPYSTDMYERNIKQGDPNFNAIDYTIHRMNPYERTINSYLRIPEKVREDEFQMSDVLPSVFQPMF